MDARCSLCHDPETFLQNVGLLTITGFNVDVCGTSTCTEIGNAEMRMLNCLLTMIPFTFDADNNIILIPQLFLVWKIVYYFNDAGYIN